MTLQSFTDHNQLSQATANYISQVADEAIAMRGKFVVAFSGGSLPKLVCPPLKRPPQQNEIDWAGWHVFWADERCVPLSDPESNYRLLREELLAEVDIPSDQIYPIDDSLDVVQAAADYQTKLQSLFQLNPPSLPHQDDHLQGQLPRLDLILLGMGPDGHTASLFPGHPLLKETALWVAPILNSPKPPPARITFTLPLINQARHVAFVITGDSKRQALQQILAGEGSLPAGLVQPTKGKLQWFVEKNLLESDQS